MKMMTKLGLMLAFVGAAFTLSAQTEGEGVDPIMGNPYLQKKAKGLMIHKNAATFDSTFIYTPDTLALPFFDEFSKSKFQKFEANHTDPGVTFDKVYRLHDVSNVPLPADEKYTQQVTFRREVTLADGSFQDFPFAAETIKVGSLASYPVTHIPTDVYPPFYIYDTLDLPGDESDTVWLVGPEIFQDSATQFFKTINDPTALWWDNFAYHNYSMAKDPWSLGVATFDGLDENGFPYNLGSTITNYGDMLTSKPIDMSGVDAGDSLYFSFLWQEEGLCDAPESGDSLVLEFYAKDLDQWMRIWSTNGGNGVQDFQHVHIRLENPDFFKKGFQFRFRNYGGLSGSLDHFHVDYVNLRTLSGYQDTVIRDFAFVYPVYTLLDTYTSVPWDHYKNNPIGKMSSDVQVVVRNSDNVPENEQDGSTEILYGGNSEASFVLQEALLNDGDLNYSPLTTYYSFHDFSGGSRFDETKTGLTETFEILSGATHQNSNFTLNDSTRTEQTFFNYYSYDDGSAEKAYGPTGVQSRLAIQYTPYEADSLIGVMIHFVPTVNDVSDNLFFLTVWDDNNGEPGNVIYEDLNSFPRQPVYEYHRNFFTTYLFMNSQKVAVDGTFYVGWRQVDQERLGVGLDKNIVNNDKTFYSVDLGNSWSQSQFEGSVMIRPIFSTALDPVLGIKEDLSARKEVKLYPNPTSSLVNIEVSGFDFEGVDVMNLQGVNVLHSDAPSVDLSQYPNGIYFFRVKGDSRTYKIVKQ